MVEDDKGVSVLETGREHLLCFFSPGGLSPGPGFLGCSESASFSSELPLEVSHMLDSVGGLLRVECRRLLETCVVSTLEGFDDTKDELNAFEELGDVDEKVEALEELDDVNDVGEALEELDVVDEEVDALGELDLVVELEDSVGRVMTRGTDVVDNDDREVLVLELWIEDLRFVFVQFSSLFPLSPSPLFPLTLLSASTALTYSNKERCTVENQYRLHTMIHSISK